MGFKSNITKNGMSGELYFTIITSSNEKFADKTKILLRGFESRELLYSHINGEVRGDIIAFENTYEMPLVDFSKLEREQIYSWLKENHFPNAVDIIEEQ